MPSFQFQCPRCGQRMQIRSLPELGKQIACAKCGTQILIRNQQAVNSSEPNQDLLSAGSVLATSSQANVPAYLEQQAASPSFWEVHQRRSRVTSSIWQYRKFLLAIAGVIAVVAATYLIASMQDFTKLQAINPFSDSAYSVLHDFRRFSMLVEEAVNRPNQVADATQSLKELRASEIELAMLNEHLLGYPERWNSVAPLEPSDLAKLIEKYKPDLIDRPQRIRKTIAEMDDGGRATESFISTVDVSLRQIDRLAQAVLKK